MLDAPQPAAARKDGAAQAPLVVYWEVTRACDLACRHCRLAAVTGRDPDELSTDEGMCLVEALSAFGEPKPQLVLAGGDPLKRPDIYGLVARATELGLPVGVALCATPRLAREALAHLYARGARSVSLPLDGSIPTRHDGIRLVQGSFKYTAAAARWARELGCHVQIESLACKETIEDLPDIYQRVLELDADRWCVRFPVGRQASRAGRGTRAGAPLRELNGYVCEAVLEWLYEVALDSPRPEIGTADAFHFRRIALQRQDQATKKQEAVSASRYRTAWGRLTSRWRRSQQGAAPSMPADHRGFGTHDGAGIMFISHTGDVCPSGFLPLSAGNVRSDSPVTLYREAPLFVQLRDPGQLKGKCGACEYRAACGGARSRAWAVTRDPLAADPLCLYQPRGYEVPTAQVCTAAGE